MKNTSSNKVVVLIVGFLFIIFLGIGFYFAQHALTQESKEPIDIDNLVATGFLDYGSRQDSVGVIFAPEGSASGPLSFNVDPEGSVYICDINNERIQVLYEKEDIMGGLSDDSKAIELNTLKQIPIKKQVLPFDIIVKNKNFIIIYDEIGKLYHFNNEGTKRSSLEVDTSFWAVKTEMHMVNDRIYMRCVDQIDHLIGIIEDGRLRAPSQEEIGSKIKIGIHGNSGRRYFVGLERKARGWIDIIEAKDDKNLRIELTLEGIVSIKYLNEDISGNFYIQVERITDDGLSLEVQKYNNKGDLVDTMSIPNNDYHYWTVKLLTVDENGSIYQMLPLEDGIELNQFQF